MAHSAPLDANRILSYSNPNATGYSRAEVRLQAVQQRLLSPAAEIIDIDHVATCDDITGNVDGPTLAYSDGGDGTVRTLIAAMAGIVPDSPEATAGNFESCKELARQLVFFAAAGGNANNWPLSALGTFAAHPERLTQGNIRFGYHRPIRYEIHDQYGNFLGNNIATSCIGLGIPAIAAHEIGAAKPVLNTKSHPQRLFSEAAIMLGAARSVHPFSVLVSETGGVSGRGKYSLSDITGYELIGSALYAKHGRTCVNVDDTKWQPIVTRRQPHDTEDGSSFAGALLRLGLGLHALSPEELGNSRSISFQLDSDEAVRYHADGETGEKLWLQPGDIMTMRLAKIAIKTIMTR